MRRFLPCLILLLLPLAAAYATEALANRQRNECVCADATDADPAQAHPASTAHAPASTAKPAVPGGSGGGSDSDLVPRLRMPKWHSFLPGMFR